MDTDVSSGQASKDGRFEDTSNMEYTLMQQPSHMCVCLLCCQYIDIDRKVFLLLSCSVKLESLLHLVILIKVFSATIRRGLSRPRGHHIVDNCAVFGVSRSRSWLGRGLESGVEIGIRHRRYHLHHHRRHSEHHTYKHWTQLPHNSSLHCEWLAPF